MPERPSVTPPQPPDTDPLIDEARIYAASRVGTGPRLVSELLAALAREREAREERAERAEAQVQVWRNAAHNHHGSGEALKDCAVCVLAKDQAREALASSPPQETPA
jgi:hypothetical protein